MPQKVEIEVCERLMDFHLVPALDDQGKIIVSRGIVPHVRAPKYHAQIKGKGGTWTCGISVDEVIGNLVRNNPEEFGIKITDLGKQAR